ncbi:hypothetical protein [Herbaspirillum huttiense]|uniref:hypothetical protein n=1 Tax=Herbaspirillum huttiense TaxID=863372 RepID=UPI002176CE21|nr:hypothetical protein [Herbaspirillum huttiense]UWE15666.1 hypothetical protein NY669_21675 [Herbaspirillum huttiense]
MEFLMLVLSAYFTFAVATMLMVVSYLSRTKDLSKTGAILFGAAMILFAGLVAYRIQFGLLTPLTQLATWLPLSADEQQTFKDAATLALWIVPFFTGAWGTNLISDAISRNFTYRSPWRPFSVFPPNRRRRVKLAGLSQLDQRIIIQSIHSHLFSILEKLPHFGKHTRKEQLLNMKDGSVVKRVPLLPDQHLFDDFLYVMFPGNLDFQKVETHRYVELQLLTAASYGADLDSLRCEVEGIYQELYGA